MPPRKGKSGKSRKGAVGKSKKGPRKGVCGPGRDYFPARVCRPKTCWNGAVNRNAQGRCGKRPVTVGSGLTPDYGFYDSIFQD